MVLGRIFPKITNFYLDGSPSEAEITYPDKVRRVLIRLGGQEEQITAGPEGVSYITKGYPSALQIKWALKLQKKKFLPYFKFFEAASLAYPDVSERLSQHDSEFVHHSALEGSYPVRYAAVVAKTLKSPMKAVYWLFTARRGSRTLKWNLNYKNLPRKLFIFWRRCVAAPTPQKRNRPWPRLRALFGLQTVRKSKLFGSPGSVRVFPFRCRTQSSCW